MAAETIDKIPIKIQVGVAVSFLVSLIVLAWIGGYKFSDLNTRLCAVEKESAEAKAERKTIMASNHKVELELKRIGTDVLWIRKEMENRK